MLVTNVKIIKFEDNNYQNMVNFWQKRQLLFDQVLPKNIINPFKEKISIIKK